MRNRDFALASQQSRINRRFTKDQPGTAIGWSLGGFLMNRVKSAGALATAFLLTTSMVPAAWAQDHDHHDRDGRGIRHVLLISIDGMHALDYINCSRGISGVNGGLPYCPTLA